MVLCNKAQLVLERAADVFELPLLPTPPLISFPSSHVLSNTLRSYLAAIQHSARIQHRVLNELSPILENVQQQHCGRQVRLNGIVNRRD